MSRLRAGDRMLVRTPSWLGDFVLAEPLLAALDARTEHDGGALTLVGPARFLELLEGRFDRAPRIPLAEDGREDPRAWRGHDLALLLNGSARSAWTAWRARIPARVGLLRGGRTPLLTGGLVPARERGRAALGRGRKGRTPRSLPRPFETVCAELGGVLGVPLGRRRPRLEPTAAAHDLFAARAARIGVDPTRPYLVLNAAGRRGSTKAWPTARWLELVRRLEKGPTPLVVLSAPGEDDVARAVLARPAPGVHALGDPPPELPELLAWIAGSAGLVTVDSGPRHLASATGASAVVLYGSTDPRHTADFLARERSLVATVPCAPCHRERCPLPDERRLACLDEFEPEAVARLAAELPASRRR